MAKRKKTWLSGVLAAIAAVVTVLDAAGVIPPVVTPVVVAVVDALQPVEQPAVDAPAFRPSELNSSDSRPAP